MKTCVIYHSVDLDGWMSAAIVKHWFTKQHLPNSYIVLKDINEICNNKCSGDKDNSTLGDIGLYFCGYNYGQLIPDLSDYDKVIMCDVSFPKEELLKLNNPEDRLVWIDHHASALREFYESFDTIESTNKFFKGLRSDKFAACELTWKYFFPNETMPEIVRLLGRYDCFGHKGTDEEQKVLEFQYASRAKISNYEEAYIWLIQWSYGHTQSWLQTGKSIYQYLCTEAKQSYKNGFEIKLFTYTDEDHMNPHKFICINKERFNAINFGIDYHIDGYDGQACFHYANGVWNFSLYSQTIDCSIIAKQYGGGGHKGAAGFQLKNINQIIK